MSGFDNMMLRVDEALTSILGDWDIYSTSIAAAILVFFAYQVFTRRDPDLHPMLLQRQAYASPVRNPGESAVYRSQSTSYGMDLTTGLNVRDPGLSKWARGRDGDLRDIWRKAVHGHADPDGKATGDKGRIFTVLGSEQVIEHNLDDLSRQINIIGKHIRKNKGSRVAIYLPNSIEFVTALFACSFHGCTPILLSYGQTPASIVSMLEQSKADTLIAPVGSLQFETVTEEYPALRQLIWVVDEGSKHMDWDEVPKGTGGAINVSTWQEIIEDHKSTSPELSIEGAPKNLIAFWQPKEPSTGKLIEYTQSNLVSAIAAQLSAVPANQRMTQSDLFLPADSLSTIYPLVLTLAALYSNSSLALNSVAGRKASLHAATQGVAPTIIVASASTLAQTQEEVSTKMGSPISKVIHWSQTRSLTQDGVMPAVTPLTKLNYSWKPSIGTKLGKLRLVYVSEQAGGDSPALSALDLSDLRTFTGARVVYALTTAEVTGAVTQTSLYDYRVDANKPGKHSHFGPPLSCVEVLLRDTKEHKTTDDLAIGEIIVRGPAVIGGEAATGLTGTFRDDCTLAYPSL